MKILKLTIASMRQQPLLTALTIAGTALAICLIMIVMMTREVRLADYGNEPYRSRTLYMVHTHVKGEDGNNTYSSGIDKEELTGIFTNLKTPETVAAFSAYTLALNAAAPGKDYVPVRIKQVNEAYFRVFPLDFTEGKGFTKEECDGNLPVAVLSRSTARKVFGTDEGITGRTLIIDDFEYSVRGMAEDVSPMLACACADIYVPLCSTVGAESTVTPPMLNWDGNIGVAILARSADDFPAIRKEVERNLAAFNRSFSPDTLDIMGQPDTQEVFVNREWSDRAPDMNSVYLRYVLIFAILLIVPAINIASMTQSRLRHRKEEIGVRRAFGARRSSIIAQTFMESLIQTIAAGLLGLLLCLAACMWLGNYIFQTDSWRYGIQDMRLDTDILFSPSIYAWALFFCFVLNVLSSLVPAWKASRGNIVEALK